MAAHSRAPTKPYVVTWRGNIAPLRPFRGHVSAHGRLELAVRAAERARNAIRDLWGAYPPWFVWEIHDARTGEPLHTIR